MRRIGLYFGSFNPIHVGHLIVARKALDDTEDMDELWFVVSPVNPHKKNSGTLECEHERLEMVKKAIADEPGFDTCDIEFHLDRPSYTHDALRELRKKHPDCKFTIIAGSDTQRKIGRWKSSKEILEHHDIIVYPRSLSEKDKKWPLTEEVIEASSYLEDVPVVDISATYIRQHIQEDKSIRFLVSDVVIDHIKENNLYQK